MSAWELAQNRAPWRSETGVGKIDGLTQCVMPALVTGLRQDPRDMDALAGQSYRLLVSQRKLTLPRWAAVGGSAHFAIGETQPQTCTRAHRRSAC